MNLFKQSLKDITSVVSDGSATLSESFGLVKDSVHYLRNVTALPFSEAQAEANTVAKVTTLANHIQSNANTFDEIMLAHEQCMEAFAKVRKLSESIDS